MNYRRFFIGLILMLGLNFVVNLLFHLMIPDNYNLAEILVSVVLAFLFALIEQWDDRGHFYKYPGFWLTFFILGIVFCLLDLVEFMIA